MPQKKEIQIVKMSKDTPDEGSEKPPKETTVPLSVQPRNIRDTAETSTVYSKKKQVSESILGISLKIMGSAIHSVCYFLIGILLQIPTCHLHELLGKSIQIQQL